MRMAPTVCICCATTYHTNYIWCGRPRGYELPLGSRLVPRLNTGGKVCKHCYQVAHPRIKQKPRRSLEKRMRWADPVPITDIQSPSASLAEAQHDSERCAPLASVPEIHPANLSTVPEVFNHPPHPPVHPCIGIHQSVVRNDGIPVASVIRIPVASVVQEIGSEASETELDTEDTAESIG